MALQRRRSRTIPRPGAHGTHILDHVDAAAEDRRTGDQMQAPQGNVLAGNAVRQVAGAAVTQNEFNGPLGGGNGHRGRHVASKGFGVATAELVAVVNKT